MPGQSNRSQPHEVVDMRIILLERVALPSSKEPGLPAVLPDESRCTDGNRTAAALLLPTALFQVAVFCVELLPGPLPDVIRQTSSVLNAASMSSPTGSATSFDQYSSKRKAIGSFSRLSSSIRKSPRCDLRARPALASASRSLGSFLIFFTSLRKCAGASLKCSCSRRVSVTPLCRGGGITLWSKSPAFWTPRNSKFSAALARLPEGGCGRIPRHQGVARLRALIASACMLRRKAFQRSVCQYICTS
mmetsp:Transcript_112931/g.224809  ORF Transcript_112931/g.224809 Transcript_112931/m.224809 type:complete len:247 (+) Transcript_112931:309-1049(+)